MAVCIACGLPIDSLRRVSDGSTQTSRQALAEFNALLAARFSVVAGFFMLRLYFLALKAVVMVVIDLPVLRGLFD